MNKERSRASELLSNVDEFVGNRMGAYKAKYEKTAYIVASLMARARSHRDLRAPAEAVNTYCKKAGCDVNGLEQLLNTVGYKLMNDHGWSFDEAEMALNELVQKMAAMGRLQYGKL